MVGRCRARARARRDGGGAHRSRGRDAASGHPAQPLDRARDPHLAQPRLHPLAGHRLRRRGAQHRLRPAQPEARPRGLDRLDRIAADARHHARRGRQRERPPAAAAGPRLARRRGRDRRWQMVHVGARVRRARAMAPGAAAGRLPGRRQRRPDGAARPPPRRRRGAALEPAALEPAAPHGPRAHRRRSHGGPGPQPLGRRGCGQARGHGPALPPPCGAGGPELIRPATHHRLVPGQPGAVRRGLEPGGGARARGAQAPP